MLSIPWLKAKHYVGIVLVDILAAYASTFLDFLHRNSLHMGMDACFITMDCETDNILLAPFATGKVVGFLCPFINALLQYDVAMVCIWIGSVYPLVAKGEVVQHVVVTTEYYADSAVRTVL